MKIKFCILALFAVVAFPTLAQDNLMFSDRLFFGGNFGLMASSSYTDIEISPHVGYYITPRWSAGIGATYKYFNDKYYFPLPNGEWERFESHIWGGRTFTNYVIVNNVGDWIPLGTDFRIYAQAEYEFLSYEEKFFSRNATGRKMQNSILVGGGFRFPMGPRSSMNLTILWNLNSNMDDIYGGRPIIRFGVNF